MESPSPKPKLTIQMRVMNLLRQGASPERLAISIAAGVVIGLFPVLGVTTVLGLAAGYVFRLNHPGVQLANYGISPLQIPVMLVLVKLGDAAFGLQTVPYSLAAIQEAIGSDPLAFAQTFWRAGVHATAIWSLGALPLGMAVYFPTRAVLSRMLNKMYPG